MGHTVKWWWYQGNAAPAPRSVSRRTWYDTVGGPPPPRRPQRRRSRPPANLADSHCENCGRRCLQAEVDHAPTEEQSLRAAVRMRSRPYSAAVAFFVPLLRTRAFYAPLPSGRATGLSRSSWTAPQFHAQRSMSSLGCGSEDMGTEKGFRVVREFSVGAGPPRRVVDALMEALPAEFPTKTAAKKVIRRREILFRGQPVSTTVVLHPGDTLQVRARTVPARPDESLREQASALRVVYQDGHLGIVVKPGGMPTHGGTEAGTGRPVRATLRSLLPLALDPSTTPSVLRRPIHVHRLDAATSGLVVAAKTRDALQRLSKLFAEREIRKRYRAVLVGKVPGSLGQIQRTSAPIGGKEAVTEWEIISKTTSPVHGVLTTVDMWPRTGRKHQLRRHAAGALGAPILGDRRYGAPAHESGSLFLCACELRFSHPYTGEPLRVIIDPPACFEAFR